ncbi:MAG: glycosyltransferase [Bacteroidaceae bacterium]|nr:glycosyltransferase [Bacteroidaceae bacterium]
MFSNISSIEALKNDTILKSASGNAACAEPMVSVVTVCFNPLKDGREELLVKNLESVQQQVGVTVEHLIIDGDSSDGTLDFLKTFDNKRHNIRILSKADTGIYDAMNRGIALSSGKYVTFLNSDDFYHRPHGLALSVKALEESGCSFSFAPILPAGSRFLHQLHRHPQLHLHRIFISPTIPHQSMLYRRSTLVELDGYDPSYRMGGDHELTLRLIAAGHKACFVEGAFVTFAEGGFSTQNNTLKIHEKKRRVRRFHKKVFGVEFSNEDIDTLVRRYRYPRKYLSIYVASQRMIDQTFVGIPQSLWVRLLHRFNFWKYYLKCQFGI